VSTAIIGNQVIPLFKVILQPQAVLDLQAHRKAGNKTLIKKIDRLLEELERHPKQGVGKPESLRYNNIDIWSRRIDDRHRMLYSIEDNIVTVYVLSLWGHYDDK
jgi:toxin YoeB